MTRRYRPRVRKRPDGLWGFQLKSGVCAWYLTFEAAIRNADRHARRMAWR